MILKNLLDAPILYLSKYIIRNKTQYYKLFKETRETQNYENWIIYFLIGIEEMAEETIQTIDKIREEIVKVKHELRDNTKIYSKELLEALFYDFYTKIPYVSKKLGISEKTTQKYLDSLVEIGILTSEKVGRERIYKNERLFNIIKNIDRD